MLTMQRFAIGVVALVLAVGLFVAVSFTISKALTAFTSRGPQAHIHARIDIAKRERGAIAATPEPGVRDKP